MTRASIGLGAIPFLDVIEAPNGVLPGAKLHNPWRPVFADIS
jgi:hypothetical protein